MMFPVGYMPLALLVASLATIYLWSNRKRYTLPLPPGPKGWPFIGNIFDIPMVKGWEVYHRWCKELGEYSSLLVASSYVLMCGYRSHVFGRLRDRRAVFKCCWDKHYRSRHLRRLCRPDGEAICYVFGKVSRYLNSEALNHYPVW